MSEPLSVSFGSLRRGPIDRTWRFDRSCEVLGDGLEDLEPLEVELRIEGDARDGLRVKGRIRSTARTECRRCLTPIRVPVDVPVDLWFRPDTDMMRGEDGVWPFAPGGAVIDLVPALREELLFAVPDYPVCEDGCAGLCPTCGVQLSDEVCACAPPAPDLRWAALHAFRDTDV